MGTHTKANHLNNHFAKLESMEKRTSNNFFPRHEMIDINNVQHNTNNLSTLIMYNITYVFGFEISLAS